MNIEIRLEDDLMLITGGRTMGAAVSSHNDHRIAMAAAVAALGAEGRVSIADSQCVAKSYPDFFNDLMKAGVSVIE